MAFMLPGYTGEETKKMPSDPSFLGRYLQERVGSPERPCTDGCLGGKDSKWATAVESHPFRKVREKG